MGGAWPTRCPHPVTLHKWVGLSTTPREVFVSCKRYSCPVCVRGRKARLARHVLAVAVAASEHHSRLRFLTLTYPLGVPASVDSRDDVIATSQRFRHFAQIIRRDLGLTFQYARVLEATKRGRIHVHALVWGDYLPKCSDRGRRARGLPTGRGSGSPCYCPATRPCLQRAAWRAGFGWADIKQVTDSDAAIRYVLKYITKQADRDHWPLSARRYSYSRGAADVRLCDIDREYREAFQADLELDVRDALGHVETVEFSLAPRQYARWQVAPWDERWALGAIRRRRSTAPAAPAAV